MTSFPALLDQLHGEGESWKVDPSDDWRQGRTLFGGISAALCLAACQRAIAELPPLRSAQIAYLGPSAGAAELRPALLRQGKSVTFMGCDLIADGRLATRALFAFGGARTATDTAPERPMPSVVPPEECPPLWTGPRPGFTQHFDQRLAGGDHPMGGGAKGDLTVWARHSDAIGADAQAALLAIGDALPPAAMSRVTEPTVISTMTWQIDLLAPEVFDPGRFVLLQSTEDAAVAGYSGQAMWLWTEDGALIGAARQNVAIFG